MMEYNKVTIGIIAFIAFGLMLFLILPLSEQSSTIIIDRPSSGNVTFNATLALDDLTDVIIISPATNQTLIYDGVNWINADITISGNGTDATSCNNLGSGVIICSGGNVNLKSLMEGNGIDLGQNSTNIQISNSGVINNIAGNGISVNQSSGNVLITNTEPEDTLCIIQPTGIGLCVNEDVELKNLIAGSGIGITTNSSHITFTNTLNVVNGTDGIDGEDGEDGINGIDGEDGIDGINGTNGTNGIDGIDGIDGANGINGTNGINGINGTNGVDGIDGINGTNGTNGTNGINGTDGFIDAINLGNGANVFKNFTASILYFKTLLAGSGISVTNGTDTITFTNTGIISNQCDKGISCSGNNPAIFNTDFVNGTGIIITGTTSQTFTNTGVLSNTATLPIVTNSSTGNVNISCPTCLLNTAFTKRDIGIIPNLASASINGWVTTITTSGLCSQSTGSILSQTGATIGGACRGNYDWVSGFGMTRNKAFEIHIPIYLSSVTGIDLEIGLSDLLTVAYSGNNDDFAVFKIDTGVSGNWYVRTNDNGAVAPATIDTGVTAVAGVTTILSIVNNESDIKFYINGVLVNTSSTDLPTVTTQIQPRFFEQTKTGADKQLRLFKITGFMDAVA